MGQIKDDALYPKDRNIKGTDTVIGSDFDVNGETKQYAFDDIKAFALQDSAFDQDNMFRFIPIYIVIGANGENISDPAVKEQNIKDLVNDYFDVTNLTINSKELVIFKIEITEIGTFKTYTRKYFFPNMLGKGSYTPLSSVINFDMLELALLESFQTPTNPNDVIQSPNNVVFDLGDITGTNYLVYLNTIDSTLHPDGYDMSNISKIYYYKFIDNGVIFMYYFDAFNSPNGYGVYGVGQQYQFSTNDLVLFYRSDDTQQNVSIQDNFSLRIEVPRSLLSGSGTEESQVTEYINSLNYNKSETTSEVYVVVYDDGDPAVTLEFDNIQALGITNLGDVNEWNSFINSDGSDVNFTSVSLDMPLNKVYLRGNFIIPTNFAIINRGVKKFDLTQLINLQSVTLSTNSITTIQGLGGLVNLEHLDFTNNNITKIQGLSSLTNLQSLLLAYNNITVLENLNGLFDLTELYLDNNNINSIQNISFLTNLTRLGLSYNNITSITNLNGLSSLEVLYLFNNQITSVPNLSFLSNIQVVSLQNNLISSVVNFNTSSLISLILENNALNTSSINSILAYYRAQNKTNFTLDLDGTGNSFPTGQGIIDKDWLNQPAKNNVVTTNSAPPAQVYLTFANINTVGVSNISDVAQWNSLLTSLGSIGVNFTSVTINGNTVNLNGNYGSVTKFIVTNKQVTDYNVSGLTNITEFTIRNGALTSVKPIAFISTLTKLDLSFNNIGIITNVDNLTNLVELNLSNNPISVIQNIAPLVNITKLYLNNTSISVIQNLNTLVALSELRLNNTSINVIQNLNVASLRTVILDACLITDTLPLHSLTQLTSVSVDDNLIPDAKINSYLAYLVSVNKTNFTFSVTGATNGFPTGQGLLDKTTLLQVGKNNVIDTNIAVVQPTSFTFSNINALGLSNINSVSVWNTYFNSKGSIGVNFTSVTINGNTASFNGNYSSITKLVVNNSLLTDYNINQLINVTYLDLSNNDTRTIKDFSALISLTYLDLSFNNISLIEKLGTFTNLQTLKLNNNLISVINGLVGLTNLLGIDLSYNNIQVIQNLSNSLTSINLSFNQLTQSTLDTYLSLLVALPKTGLTGLFDGAGNSAPSSQGIIDRDTLNNNGNTIFTNENQPITTYPIQLSYSNVNAPSQSSCAIYNNPEMVVTAYIDNPNFSIASLIFSNSEGTSLYTSGLFSDGNIERRWNETNFTSTIQCI